MLKAKLIRDLYIKKNAPRSATDPVSKKLKLLDVKFYFKFHRILREQ